MSEAPAMAEEFDPLETEATRSLLDQLVADSRLYTNGKDYKDLLDFVVRLRNFAPFNAMLLQVQKPGLSYAAPARDWEESFGRRPKEGARPLLILWPFAPVALVYDVLDTEGRELPKDVNPFQAKGNVEASHITQFIHLMGGKNIHCDLVDAGDAAAGRIRLVKRPTDATEKARYKMLVNRNHLAPVQLSTIAHELGHLFLGHLGPDKHLAVPTRASMNVGQMELEAESVAYLVCCRHGVKPNSDKYLSSYVKATTSVDIIDTYQVMRAAGQVETVLELAERSNPR